MIKINKGDVIIITDQDALSVDVKGLHLVVTEVTVIKEQAKSCVWQLITTDSDRVFVVKSTWDGSSQDIKAMWASDDMPMGNKLDWVKAGFNWLFLQPDNEQFKGKDLVYTEEIYQNDYQFIQKSPTWFGTVDVDGGEDIFFAIHEWASHTAEYDEIIVFEGGANNDEGGYITFLQGRNISDNEFEVLNRIEENNGNLD